MKARPILFSGQMIRALLAGTKSQTRRVVKPQPEIRDDGSWSWNGRMDGFIGGIGTHVQGFQDCASFHCRYGRPGDLLWVRETCRADEDDAGLGVVWFAADGAVVPIENTVEAADRWVVLNHYGDTSGGRGNLVPSIHMPRWASRLTLRITDVRVELLQDISEADAAQEGCGLSCASPDGSDSGSYIYGPPGFIELWQTINGVGSWAANPWVFAISSEVIKANVDAVITS